jgi:hypothetical protein
LKQVATLLHGEDGLPVLSDDFHNGL